jgi:cytochrome c556
MKKEMPTGAVIAAIVVLVLIIGFFIYRGLRGDRPTATARQIQLMKVLERTKGDVTRMTPDERKFYEEAVRTGFYSPTNAGSTGSSGYPSPPQPGAR